MSFLAQLKVHFTNNHPGHRGELDKERHHQATSEVLVTRQPARGTLIRMILKEAMPRGKGGA